MNKGTAGVIEQPYCDTKPLIASPDQQIDMAALYNLLWDAETEGQMRLSTSNGVEVSIPKSFHQVLARIAQMMAYGDGVTIIPVSQRLTVQQAADILNVPRPYMLRLLELGQIPSMGTGSDRLIHNEDILAYKQKRDQDRKATLDRLANLSQVYSEYEG